MATTTLHHATFIRFTGSRRGSFVGTPVSTSVRLERRFSLKQLGAASTASSSARIRGRAFKRERGSSRLEATAEDDASTGTKDIQAVDRRSTLVSSSSNPASCDSSANDGKENHSDRLWSNLASDSGTGAMTREPGSLPGAIALVAGTTVGAGMLALPAVCQSSGFFPSTVALFSCWLYMLGTGLLVLEVNVDVMKATGKKSASIVTMADRTLGVNGVRFAWAAYVFIHYALLVAYISRAGELLAGALPTGDFLEFLSRVPGSATPLLALVDSRSFAGTAYAAALGSVMFFSSPKTLDAVNGVLVVAVLALFAPLLGLAGSAARLENFTEPGDWTAVPSTIPVIALAFVFHNVVPVVSSQLEGDPEKSKTALIIGTAIPFCMFASWNAALLGSVSQRDALEALAVVARSGGDVQAFADPLVALQNTSRVASGLVSWFSFFAISTSFLGFVLGLVDFLTDGLGFERDDSRGGSKTPNGNDWRPFALALVPPWALALSYPDIFLDALDSAGTFGVLTLFGCMPPAMAWSTRYGSGPRTFQSAREDSKREPRNPKPHLVPGGKPVLVACFGLAAIVVFTESARKLGGVVFDR